MITLWRYIKNIFLGIVYLIPITVVFSGIYFFFTVILFEAEYVSSFSQVWKNMYLFFAVFYSILESLRSLTVFIKFSNLARKNELAFSQVEKAFYIYEIHKIFEPETWTKKMVESRIKISEDREQSIKIAMTFFH